MNAIATDVIRCMAGTIDCAGSRATVRSPMILVVYNDSHLGLLCDGQVIDLTDLVPPDVAAWPRTFVIRAIADFDRLRPAIEQRVTSAPRIPVADVKLNAPVVCPSKI